MTKSLVTQDSRFWFTGRRSQKALRKRGEGNWKYLSHTRALFNDRIDRNHSSWLQSDEEYWTAHMCRRSMWRRCLPIRTTFERCLFHQRYGSTPVLSPHDSLQRYHIGIAGRTPSPTWGTRPPPPTRYCGLIQTTLVVWRAVEHSWPSLLWTIVKIP